MSERMTLRYVVHGHIKKYEEDGWEIVSRLSYPHSQHAVLMKKVQHDRPSEPS